MATKIPTTNQHEPLHALYPGDCCLCKAEAHILDFTKEIMRLTKELEEKDTRIRELEEVCHQLREELEGGGK